MSKQIVKNKTFLLTGKLQDYLIIYKLYALRQYTQNNQDDENLTVHLIFNIICTFLHQYNLHLYFTISSL